MAEENGNEVHRLDIKRERETATQMLADAETAASVDISKATIVNRLYYACFHVAQAALYDAGHRPKSHGHVQTLLGSELVQSGRVPSELGRFFNDIATYRNRVDYGVGGVERSTDELIDETRQFVDVMVELLDDDEC